MLKATLVTVLFALSLVPAAQTPPPASPAPAATTLSDFARARVDEMLRGGHADPDWFSPSFLSQVPASKVDALLVRLKSVLGEYKSVDGTNGDYTARFVTGTSEVFVHLDASNRIDGLLFKPPSLLTSSLDDALRQLAALGGTLSYVIVAGHSEDASLNASAPLAVGSAFKLAVLAALRDQIAQGRRHWSDVIPLQARWKSLPSGVIYAWPDDTPITIATYAAEMISISDNTAADAMVRLDGPAALAPYGARNMPFLTTREAFILHSTSGAALRTAYLAARSTAERATVLRLVDSLPLPAADTLSATPNLGVEWHFSVRELCRLMGRVADLPVMSINPGVADPTSFRHVAYKGGSDTGVINLTTQVTTKRGTTLCLSATLNDPAKAVDDGAFARAYAVALKLLANR